MQKTYKLLIVLCSGLICSALLAKQLAPDQSDSETEAGSSAAVCTADCDNQTISTQNLLSDIQSIPKTTASCELAESKHKLKDGKLTDYWAQEMIGADLLREEIEKAPPLPEDKHLVAVFDSLLGSHNTYVQNIISHKGPQAVLPALNSSQLKFFHTHWNSDYMEAAETLSSPKESTQNVKPAVKETTVNKIQNMEPSGNFPSFINNSMGWGGKNTHNALSRIIPPSILVHSAGNNYLKGSLSVDPVKREFSKNFDSIIVGSLSPKGVVSHFSQEGEEVHILAPSDNYITSVDDNGKYKKFGGTSGAAPLVTGSLAGFEWLSGYHPTAKEAKFLLENTAVPTIHSEFEEPQKNGRGMLNAYKLGRVAKRLKDRCQNNHQCFTQEIQNPENYQFAADQSVLDDVRSAFPQCSGAAENAQETDCTFKKAAFKKLRQAVLLDTTNVELWRQLQCIYNQEGFSENALAVETTLWALSKTLPDSNAINDPSFRRIIEDSIFGVSRIEPWGLEILQTLAADQDTSAEIKKMAAKAVRIVGGGDAGLAMLQTLAADKDAEIRVEVAWRAVVKVRGDAGLALLQTLVTDEDEEVRREVAWGAGEIGGAGGLALLQTLAADKSTMVRRAVAETAGKIGGAGGLALLQTLAADQDAEVRREVAWGAREIGGDEGLKLLQTLVTDQDAEVRREVAWGAGEIGGDEGLKLLRILVEDSNEEVRKEAVSAINKLLIR